MVTNIMLRIGAITREKSSIKTPFQINGVIKICPKII